MLYLRRRALPPLTWACAVGVLLSASAPAQERAPTPPAAADLALLEEAGITLAPPEPPLTWSGELVAELARGLEALPEHVRSVPGGRLQLALRSAPAPFGMGDGSDALPEWDGGTRTFLLYAYDEPDDARALFRLGRLTSEERQRLWRRRAIVHAVIRRWDAALRWSAREDWKLITGWKGAFDGPLTFGETATNRYDWAYSRARGRASASLDLATFAEEALVPPEAIRPRAFPVDDALECQEFSKLRYLRRVLRLPEASRNCPLFEAWAAFDRLTSIELLFSAPSGQRLQSLFGHLMIRPVHAPGPFGGGPAFEPVVEIAAVTGLRTDPVRYVWRGLTGGFDNVFTTSSMAVAITEHVGRDQRTLRRFRLELTEPERVRVMERIWELERRGYFPYYFLSDNCASYVLYLINGALDGARRAKVPGPLMVIPGAALDALGDAGLISHAPLDLLSRRTLAAEAERERDATIRALVREVPEALGEGWRRFGERASSRDPLLRRAAWDTLSPLITESLRHVAPERLYRVVTATQQIERYLAEAGQNTVAGIEGDARIIPADLCLPTAESLIAERQRRYRREDPDQRRLEDLSRYIEVVEVLEALPRRPYTAEEQEAIADAEALRHTFIAFSRVHGELLEGPLSSVDSEALERDEAERLRARVLERNARSIQSSGWGRLALGLGAVSTRQRESLRPQLLLQTALWSERLGERRLHGFDPRVELRLLDGRVRLEPPHDGRLSLPATELDVVKVRSFLREPEIARTSVLHHLGWGAGYRFHRAAGSAALVSHVAHGTGYVLLRANPEFSDFTALGVGLSLDAQARFLPQGAGGGPTLELLHRSGLPGAVANSLSLEAAYTPRLSVWGGDGVGALSHVVDARAVLQFQLGGPRGVLIGPSVELGWEKTGSSEGLEVLGALWVEWL